MSVNRDGKDRKPPSTRMLVWRDVNGLWQSNAQSHDFLPLDALCSGFLKSNASTGVWRIRSAEGELAPYLHDRSPAKTREIAKDVEAGFFGAKRA
jgi:hypothetical protein